MTATDEEHRKSQLESGGAQIDKERNLRSPFDATNAVSSRQSHASPISRGFLGQSATRMTSTMQNGVGMASSMNAGGMMSTMHASGMTPVLRPDKDRMTDKSHVSLTFKKFRQESQKEHTREILPNVTPAIKR